MNKKPTLKNFLYFRKWKFLAISLISYISGGNLQNLKNKNFLYFSKKSFPTHFEMTADEAVK